MVNFKCDTEEDEDEGEDEDEIGFTDSDIFSALTSSK